LKEAAVEREKIRQCANRHKREREDKMTTDADNNAGSATRGASRGPFRAAVSRRKFVKAAAAGAGALVTAGRVGRAQSSETIKIGFITPRSGALAAFGETDAFVLDTSRKLLADGFPPAASRTRSKFWTAIHNPIRRAPASWQKR
jgi:hypothetical protein